MSRYHCPGHNSYELTEDALQILKDNDMQFETVSASTASDLPGLGRTIDLSISRAGGLLEKIVASAANRLGKTGRAHVCPPNSSQNCYDLHPDVFNVLKEGVDFESASLSTISDRPGPGRTLDKLYTAVGRTIESLTTNTLANIGVGPDGAMVRLVKRLLGDYFIPVLQSLRHINRMHALISLDGVILLSVLANDAPKSPKDLKKASNLLIQCLKQDNLSSKIFAMSYIEALTTLVPEAAAALDQSGLQAHLKRLVGRLSSIGYLEGTESVLLVSSRRALVSTADTRMLAMIKEYDTIEKTLEDKINATLLADRFMPHLTSLLFTAFSSDHSSNLPFIPLIKSLTKCPPPFWLHHVLSLSLHLISRSLTPEHMRQWLWQVMMDRDLVRRAMMVRLVNSLLRSIQNAGVGVGSELWVWESIWIPLCEFTIILTKKANRNKKRKRKGRMAPSINPFDFPCPAMKPPTSLSSELEHSLMRLSGGLDPCFTPAPIVNTLTTTGSLGFRVFARFVYEWQMSATLGRQRFVLGFQAKVREETLRQLSQRIVKLAKDCLEMLREVIVIFKRDPDVYETLLEQLRESMRTSSVSEFGNLRRFLDELSSACFKPQIIKLSLESKIQDKYHGYSTDESRTHIGASFYRDPGRRRIGFFVPKHERCGDVDYSKCERLMGDLRSVRWVPASEMRKGMLRYFPIIGDVDNGGRRYYIACMSILGACDRPRPYCLLFNEDFRGIDEVHSREWERVKRDGRKPDVYILAVRALPGARNVPHIYWASPSWNNRLCTCSDIGCRCENLNYSVTYSRSIHIPNALPDTRFVNAITLEETFVGGGETKEVAIMSWFGGGPTLFFRSGKWCWFDSITG